MKTKHLVLAAALMALSASTFAGEGLQEALDTTQKALDATADIRANAVQIVTSANKYEEMDKMSQALIQLCLKEECAAQKKVLDKLAPSYTSVSFVQMSTSDNVDFANRIKLEQEAVNEGSRNIVVRWWRALMRFLGLGGKPEAMQYPMYVFKGNDLNVAPDGVVTEAQLEQFIKLNASYAQELAPTEPAVTPAISGGSGF